MISKLKRVACSFVLIAASSTAGAADEFTQYRSINEVIVTGTHYYVSALPGALWTTPSCPTITYLWIPRSDPGSSQLLAAVLSAKGGAFQLLAVGNCSEFPGYFRTNYVFVQ